VVRGGEDGRGKVENDFRGEDWGEASDNLAFSLLEDSV